MLISVSYTHLDVYKRQEIFSTDPASSGKIDFSPAWMTRFARMAAIFPEDVYKRQRAATKKYKSPTGNIKERFWRTQARQPFTRSFAPCSERAYRFCSRFIMLLYLPVSYTHLDVYKRQQIRR